MMMDESGRLLVGKIRRQRLPARSWISGPAVPVAAGAALFLAAMALWGRR